MILDQLFGNQPTMPQPHDALAGRATSIFSIPATHAVLGVPLQPPFPDGLERAVFGLGCFWGAERLFWQTEGVYLTAVGYSGGYTPNPTYEEVCSGYTGHAEVVMVVYDPTRLSYAELLKIFFEAHDPTQGMRQGGDIGTQYRSMIQYTDAHQHLIAERAAETYNESLHRAGFPAITTEIVPQAPFYYAEGYHQQYLHKVPNGYCGLAGTGVSCAMPERSGATS